MTGEVQERDLSGIGEEVFEAFRSLARVTLSRSEVRILRVEIHSAVLVPAQERSIAFASLTQPDSGADG